MKIIKIIVISAAVLCLYSYGKAFAQYGRNIRIEVEFREEGQTHAGIDNISRIRTATTRKSSRQFILVQDGSEATIRVGRDVPYVSFYRAFLYDYGLIESAEISFAEVGTSLKVRPDIMGQFIQVWLTPQISYVADDERFVVEVQELSTSVTVLPGQPVTVGGLIRDQEFENFFLKNEGGSRLQIILTAYFQ
jgi:hypothetical protein